MQILWPDGGFTDLLDLLLLWCCRHFLYQVSMLIIPVLAVSYSDRHLAAAEARTRYCAILVQISRKSND